MAQGGNNVWVYGRGGWYMAQNGWDGEYAARLKKAGWDVEMSVAKPDRKGVDRASV